MPKPTPGGYRVITAFAVPGTSGFPRLVAAGSPMAEDDPLVKTHRSYLQPVSEFIEQATQAPGERRPVRIPTPEPQTRNKSGDDMPHTLPPEDENSPASPFAPGQPGAGVVADDVPPEQNPAGGPKASDAPRIENAPPEPQTPQQAAASSKSATKKSADK